MKKLFIAMPYGCRKAALDDDQPDKTVEINFDDVWDKMLRPAIPQGFEKKRADELRKSGLVDRLYNEWLFDADIVLADLTFGNPNVYYELGIRQALSKKATVLIACKGTRLPFDVRNQAVINYDYFAAPTLPAFQEHLHEAINNASGQETDSPVHVFLPGLSVGRYVGEDSPESKIRKLTQHIEILEGDLTKRRSKDEEVRLSRKIREADSAPGLFRLYQTATAYSASSVDLLEQLAIRLRKFGYIDQALEVLQRALRLNPQDPEILRELGFVYRKKGPLSYVNAEKYFREAITLNDSDAELHGMLGGLLKRREDYVQALVHYRRAHELEPESLYAIVNMGGIAAALGNTPEALHWYQALRDQCNQVITNGKSDYWTYLCLGEASVALGDKEQALSAYRKAIAQGAPIEDFRSAIEQLEFLIKSNFSTETSETVLRTLLEEPTTKKKF